MAFTNLFRRHSGSHENPASNYACLDESSIAEMLLEELESQCQNCFNSSTKSKRNSEVYDISSGGGLLASTYEHTSVSKRHSVDYSWLTPSNNLLQTPNELYHLSDIIKMELMELIRNVSPNDCTHIVSQFRRQSRSQIKVHTPENIIALFRKTLAEYIEEKTIQHSNTTDLSCKTISALGKPNKVLPRHSCELDQQSVAELHQISLTSQTTDPSDATKPRSNTCI